jgi:hypothetical protein
MGKSRKPQRTWVYSPAKDPRTKVSDALRGEVERKANELIDTALKAKYIEPPPKNPKFNYAIGLSTRWHGRYFYFVATYACPGPNAISPTFSVNFARLEHTATGRYNLAFMRHTGKWHELFSGQTLGECLTAIRDDPWFHP